MSTSTSRRGAFAARLRVSAAAISGSSIRSTASYAASRCSRYAGERSVANRPRASTTTVALVSRALDAIDVAIDARRRAFEWAPPDDDARGRPFARLD